MWNAERSLHCRSRCAVGSCMLQAVVRVHARHTSGRRPAPARGGAAAVPRRHTVALPPDFAAIRTFSLKKSQKALQTLTIIHLMHPEPFPVTRNAGMPGFRPIFATIRPSPDLLRSSQAPLAMGIAVDSCPAVQEKSPFSRFHNLPQHAEPSSRPTNAHKACHNHESALIMQGTW